MDIIIIILYMDIIIMLFSCDFTFNFLKKLCSKNTSNVGHSIHHSKQQSTESFK